MQTAVILAVDTIALLVMAQVSTIVGLTGAVVVATVALMSGSTVYQVLLPEIVPRRFWGTAAGFRGAMTLVGTIVGLALAALLPAREALLVERPASRSARADAVLRAGLAAVRRRGPTGAQVRDRWDLFVTLIGRAWIVLGMTLLNTYVLFFFNDVLGIRNASFSTGLVAAAAMVGAVASSVAAGVLSDKLDRRLVVCLSGLPMTLAALGFALLPRPARDLHLRRAVRPRLRRRVLGRLGARARRDPRTRRRRARSRHLGDALELADGDRAGARRRDHRARLDAERRLSLAVRDRQRAASCWVRSPCSPCATPTASRA